MAKLQDQEGEIIADINIIPLVDIVFVLLMVFMLTATYIVKATIEVDLPRAASGGESVGQMLTVILGPKMDAANQPIPGSKCETLAVNGNVTTEEGLKAAAKEALAKDPEAKAIISADQGCQHGEFVHIVDVVKLEGITKFAINIEKVEAPAAAPSAPAPSP